MMQSSIHRQRLPQGPSQLQHLGLHSRVGSQLRNLLLVSGGDGDELFVELFHVLGVAGVEGGQLFIVEAFLVEEVLLGLGTDRFDCCAEAALVELTIACLGLASLSQSCQLFFQFSEAIGEASVLVYNALGLAIVFCPNQCKVKLCLPPYLISLKLSNISLALESLDFLLIPPLPLSIGNSNVMNLLPFGVYFLLEQGELLSVVVRAFLQAVVIHMQSCKLGLKLLQSVNLFLQLCTVLVLFLHPSLKLFVPVLLLQQQISQLLDLLHQSALLQCLPLQNLQQTQAYPLKLSDPADHFHIISALLGIICLSFECLDLSPQGLLILLLNLSHADDDQIHAIRQCLAALIIHLATFIQHLLNIGLILDLFNHHWLLLYPLQLLALHQEIVTLPVPLLEILLQLFDDVGHLFLVAAFFGLELADQSAYFIVFLLLEQLHLHLVGLALDLQVQIFVLLDSQQFVQSLLFLETLLDLPILPGQLPLNKPQFLTNLLNLDQTLLIFHFNLRELILQILLILPQSLDGLLILLMHSSLTLDLIPQLMDGLLEEDLVVEQFLDLPHAVAYDYLQLFFLEVDVLDLS